MAVNPGRLPFAEALAFFKDKLSLPTQKWDDLLGSAHDRAFVVAGVMLADLLADLRAAVNQAITDGQTLDSFRQDFSKIIVDRGWLQDKTKGYLAWRSRVIYETNLFTSYAAGRYQQLKEVADARPYWRYRHSDASVVPRPAHLAWDGTILRHDDSWWSGHYPPGGWGCFLAGTEVATPAGWRAIETLRRGDLVIGGSGNVQTVKAPQVRPFDGDIVWVTTKQGQVAATPNHRFLTLRGWVRAENLEVGEILVQIPQVARFYDAIGNIQQVDSPRAQLGMARPFHGFQSPTSKAFNPYVDFLQKYIDPIGEKAAVMDRAKPPIRQLPQKQRFNSRWWRMGVDMSGWVLLMQPSLGLDHLGAHFRPECRRIGFQFFRAAAYTIIRFLGFPKAVMAACRRLLQRSLPQDLRGLLFAKVVPDPLNPSPLAVVSGLHAEPFHQPHHRAVVTSPSLAKTRNRPFLFEIQDPEGFVSGAPLDRFDSLQDFIRWARTHGVISNVVSIRRQPYISNVYNLSITEDASYCLRFGVVHNCKCYVESLSEREMEKSGLAVTPAADIPYAGTVTVVDKKTGAVTTLPEGIDRGWDYAPGANVAAPLAGLLKDRATVWPPELTAAVAAFLKPALSAETWAAIANALGIAE